jgi:F-type H+-transporting ATPase subunit delta
MRRGASGRRYAEAAFQIAERDGTVDRWLAELEAAAERLRGDEVANVLENPAVPMEERVELVDRLLGAGVQPQVRNLLHLLLRRGRVDHVVAVAAEFRRLHHRRAGITTATVTSAAPLEPEAAQAITRRLEEMTTGRVELSFQVDPELLGGVVVRVGDRLIDGSVRGRLERLRTELAARAG